MGTTPQSNRFQDFFEEERYLVFKNHLYNYRLRRRAVERAIEDEPDGLILEIGSGISPVMARANRIVYSDLSFLALCNLKCTVYGARCVVADAARLPFASGVFSHAVASEVLEHLPNDRPAVRELARVIAPGGHCVVTFPHRRAYAAYDDRFVNHYRRYELEEMQQRLEEAGMRCVDVQAVLGLLDKLAIMVLVACFSLLARRHSKPQTPKPLPAWVKALAWAFKWANRLYALPVSVEARILPQTLATVLLIKAQKREETACVQTD